MTHRTSRSSTPSLETAAEQSPAGGQAGLRPYRGTAIATTFLAITVLSSGDLIEIIPVFAPFVAGPLFPFVHETHDILAAMLALYVAHKLTPAVGTRATVWFLALHLPYAYLRFPAELPELVRIALTGAAAFLGIYIIWLRKRAEDRLRLQATALDAAANAIFITDRRGVIEWVNPAFTRVTGHSAEEAIGQTPRILKSGKHTRAFYKTLWDTILAGEVWRAEMVNRTRDGELFHAQQTITPLRGPNGEISRFVAIQQDITERVQAEAALRESERNRRLVLDNVDEIVYFVELGADNMLSGQVRFVSGRVEKILGYQSEEFIRDRELWFSSIHPDDVPVLAESTRAIFASGQPSMRAYRMRSRRTEDYHWMEDHVVPQLDSAGVVIGQFGVARDITERKHAEEGLRNAEARYRTIFEQSPNGVLLIDLETGKTIEANETAHKQLGYTREEFAALRISDYEALENPEETAQHMQKIIHEGSDDFETLHRTKSGELRNMHVWAKTVQMSDRVLFYAIFQDITERKEREREREAIATVAAALRIALTRAEMLPVILDQLLNLLKVDGALLAMRDPANSETIIELGRGPAGASFTGVRLPPGEGISGHVIATSQPYLNNAVQSDPRFAGPDLLPPDIRAAACVPLIVQGQTIGALCLLHARDIPADEIRLLTAIAEFAANAIHRATLHEQTERRLQRLTALRAVDIAISSSFDLRTTLNILLDQSTTNLQVDAADILLYNRSMQTLDYAAGRGFRGGGITRSHLRLGEGQAGRAALERRTNYIPNLAEETTFVRSGLLANENFIAHYVTPLIAKSQLKGVLEVFHRAPLAPNPEWSDFLEALAGQAAIAIDNAELFDGLQRSNTELVLAYDTTIEGWSRALDLRDKETEGHTQRVTEMTEWLAQALGLSEAEIVHIRRGALLHDIGKLGVPDAILLKPSQLTDEEWVRMRRHPQFAREMLAPIAYLNLALDIPYCHHEKWDGTGYPRGLKGEQIPLAARIFAVVDVWDALRSDRPYRSAWPEEKVREYIREQAGKHFDSQVVEAFLAMAKD